MPLLASIAQDYTEDSCRLILDEAVTLLEDTRLAAPSHQRLNLLLANHFVSNNFRSVCCFGHSKNQVSLEQFNSLCLLPSTNWTTRLDFLEDSTTTILPSPVDSTFSASNYLLEQKYTLLGENVVILLLNILESHPEREFILEHVPRTIGPLWSLAILGLKKDHNKELAVIPNLEELRRRITLSLHGAVAKKRASPAIKFFSQDNGFMWQALDDSFDVNKVYLQVCSAFPARLEKLLLDSGKTLDQLAGVDVSHRYPKVEALVSDALARGQKQGFESVDLKLADGSLGGTVFAIHNAHYSVAWIAAYLVDTDNNLFMEDVRAASLSEKERLLRVFSTYHTEHEPSWVQFGDKASVFLYLSRLASAAEQGFLKIQSYVINLLLEDINSTLAKLSTTNGKYRLEPFQYDTGVVALGNPTTSSLGAHQDGKPGIICPHTHTFSPFMLMVPTMAFQNNCGPTATISWWCQDDPKKVVQAVFTHDFFINHYQMMGVNHYFAHAVRIRVLFCLT
jgi:hypothetical protein